MPRFILSIVNNRKDWIHSQDIIEAENRGEAKIFACKLAQFRGQSENNVVLSYELEDKDILIADSIIKEKKEKKQYKHIVVGSDKKNGAVISSLAIMMPKAHYSITEWKELFKELNFDVSSMHWECVEMGNLETFEIETVTKRALKKI